MTAKHTFQSTRPIRGATRGTEPCRSVRSNFNPRAPYGARLHRTSLHFLLCGISIHAPHAGRDCLMRSTLRAWLLFQSTRPIRGATRTAEGARHLLPNFNPRAPYGARRATSLPVPSSMAFQSTRPIRGATLMVYLFFSFASHFNPRAPYGARLTPIKPITMYCQISIHAPHTGRDSTWPTPGA